MGQVFKLLLGDKGFRQALGVLQKELALLGVLSRAWYATERGAPQDLLCMSADIQEGT